MEVILKIKKGKTMRKVKKLFLHKCEQCSKEFTSHSKKSKYCCAKCKRAAGADARYAWHYKKSLEKYANDPDALTCKICGFKGIELMPHIINHHNITVEEYNRMFGTTNDDLLSKKARQIRIDCQKNSTNPNKKRFSSENNPAKGHGGKFSPFSKNFIKYEGLSEEEKENKIAKLAEQSSNTAIANHNKNSTIDYYTSRGYSEEEASKLLSEIQATFSKEKGL